MFGLLRALLMKVGYFLSLSDNYFLNEPGDSGMMLVSVDRLQYCANGDFASGRTHACYSTPFDVTHMIGDYTRGMKDFFVI